MSKKPHLSLSRRERQILDLLYRRGRATAAEVHEGLPEAPGYSAVRALLRIQEETGHARHEAEGPRYVYRPAVPRDRARRSALTHLVETFFNGSTEQAVAALLDTSAGRLQPEELDKLAERIEKVRREGR